MKKHIATYNFIGFLLSLYLILFLGYIANAQEYRQKIDSLISGKTPPEQLQILNDESQQWRYSNLNYAYEICDTALVIARHTENMTYVARALCNLGIIFHLAEELTLADSLYQK